MFTLCVSSVKIPLNFIFYKIIIKITYPTSSKILVSFFFIRQTCTRKARVNFNVQKNKKPRSRTSRHFVLGNEGLPHRIFCAYSTYIMNSRTQLHQKRLSKKRQRFQSHQLLPFHAKLDFVF